MAIPTYTMSCFKLPATLCSELELLMANLLWGQNQEEQKIRWVGWKRMCKTKELGGLGFKDLKIFNQALLANQAWRIMTDETTLLHKLYKARYFPSSNFHNSRLGSTPSYVWRGTWESKDDMLRGCRWRVGDGKSIKVWTDHWIPGDRVLQQLTQENIDETLMVEDLIDENTRWWNIEKVRRLLPPAAAGSVLKILISNEVRLDCFIWDNEKDGVFSVKSAYDYFQKLDRQEGECSNADNYSKFWTKLWKLKLPNKIKIFAWRACKNGLPTRANLKGRFIINET
ncbi:uncharacterized mitochondrial protein AtMg00310-like [Carya illinoinensis]|uniref:uncharacterized mitochondrial protein AtMg00310-like n=1 Tax=Carya illinoinensis TaxID=32201 RepID=UPI001C71B471|nr:uncharacterized mitochondrial protein AtMg00310-like [Carya illinoinensis]